MNPEEAKMSQGFDVAVFIKKAKNHLGYQQKIRVIFPDDKSRASSKIEAGVATMEIPSVVAIKRLTGLGEGAAQAKSKGAIVEEICHLKLSKEEHDSELFECVRKGVRALLTLEEQANVSEKMGKMERFASVHEALELEDTPIYPTPRNSSK